MFRNHRFRYLSLTGFTAVILSAGIARAQSGHTVSPAVQSAQRQFNAGDYSGAINSLRSASAMTSSDADLARKVKTEFETAVHLNPSNIPARRDLEEYCLDAPWIAGGSKDEAKAQVDAIAAIDPVQGHVARAEYDALGLKKTDLADNEYHQALEVKSTHIDAYLDAADFYIKQNRPADLANVIDAAVRVAPSDPRLAFYRGVQRILATKDLPQAEQYLKSYLASTPDRSEWPPHAAAREWLGRLYQLEGKHAEAAEQFRAALQIDPHRKEARTRLDQLEKAAH